MPPRRPRCARFSGKEARQNRELGSFSRFHSRARSTHVPNTHGTQYRLVRSLLTKQLNLSVVPNLRRGYLRGAARVGLFRPIQRIKVPSARTSAGTALTLIHDRDDRNVRRRERAGATIVIPKALRRVRWHRGAQDRHRPARTSIDLLNLYPAKNFAGAVTPPCLVAKTRYTT